MSRNIEENTKHSYKNPFDDYNANVLDPQAIIKYWFTPFSTGALKGLTEGNFVSQKMPIILEGSRGSGKTTILKYFSFPVQRERAKQNGTAIMEQIVSDGGVGFYLRCDDSFLNVFQSVFQTTTPDAWMKCFEHYLELFFAKSIIEMLQEVSSELGGNAAEIITKRIQLSARDHATVFDSLLAIKEYITSEIRYISSFTNNALFTNEKFTPTYIWSFYDISEMLINAAEESMPELKGINYLLLLDEFENLPSDLQRLFNTLIKFCKPKISMRVGRRSENTVTTETVNAVEYLRKDHDYDLVTLDVTMEKNENQKNYLKGIAERRLSLFEETTLPKNIVDVLGEKENLDEECLSVADERNLHIRFLLGANQRVSKDQSLMDAIIEIIKYPENRIAEMLNALWVARSSADEDLISVAETTVEAMRAFLGKKEHPLMAKYKHDYNNKYRYALTVALCVAYKKEKAYYSFNTICYLSEGNTRTFINFCKAIINDAMFYEQNKLMGTGKVSPVSQSRAIREYSMSEFNSVCSIIQRGNAIRCFVMNLGNIFSEYHKDDKVRYPETNQFVFDYSGLRPNTKEVLDIAISWSIIRKKLKDTPKRLSINISKSGDIYTINKIFAPIFSISYRTRGGFNVDLTTDMMETMVSTQLRQNVLNGMMTQRRKAKSKACDPEELEGHSGTQMTLFGEEMPNE